MPKAHITTHDGAKITIEGSVKEVAEIMSLFKNQIVSVPTKKSATTKPVNKPRETQSHQRVTPINLISSLIDGGFFKKPKDLASVKVALEELGHVYPVTSLSPALLRLVRKRQIRRIKDKKRWLYTGHPIN